MKKGKPSLPERQLAELMHSLRREYAAWQILQEPDGGAPIWAYTKPLEWCHNSICAIRGRIKELCDRSGLPLPEEYDRPVPPYDFDDYAARYAVARMKEIEAQIPRLQNEAEGLKIMLRLHADPHG